MNSTKTLAIVEILEKKIARDYSPGDRFYSAAELAAEMKIGGLTANNALRILERRGIIIRRRRLGAIVAERQTAAVGEKIVVFEYRQTASAALARNRRDALVVGLQDVFPNATIEFAQLSEPFDATTALSAFAPARDGRREGFILWSVSLDAQRFFAESRLPGVILGSRYPSVPATLPSIAYDDDAATRLIRNYLRGANCRRVLCFYPTTLVGADARVVEKMQTAFRDVDFRLIFMPFDKRVYGAEIARALREYSPDAMICHSSAMTEAALESCEAVGRRVGRDVEIVQYVGEATTKTPTPCVLEARGFEYFARTAGLVLKRVLDGEEVGDEVEPMKMNIPAPNDADNL